MRSARMATLLCGAALSALFHVPSRQTTRFTLGAHFAAGRSLDRFAPRPGHRSPQEAAPCAGFFPAWGMGGEASPRQGQVTARRAGAHRGVGAVPRPNGERWRHALVIDFATITP